MCIRDSYDFDPKKKTLIRATEGTVISRIPPRVKIRENAAIEPVSYTHLDVYKRQLQSCLSLPKGLAEQTDYTENNTDYHCQIW